MKLSELVEASLAHDDAAFAKHFPDAALVFESHSPATGELVAIDTPSGGSMAYRQTDALRATDSFQQKSLLSVPRAAEIKGKDSVVIFLAKSSRNPFAAMITLGRARNNDICLPLSSISKVHAYFQKKPGRGGMTLTDQRSTNGTTLDDKPLEPMVGADVHDGARLAFGPDVHARFYTPEGLFGYLALCRAGI